MARTGHPLVQALSLHELHDCDGLLPPPSEESAIFEKLCLRYGIAVPTRHIHLVHSASPLLHLVAHSDMVSLCPWPQIETEGSAGGITPLRLSEPFEPNTAGLLQRGHGHLPFVAQRFVAHLVQQAHACQHTADPRLQGCSASLKYWSETCTGLILRPPHWGRHTPIE